MLQGTLGRHNDCTTSGPMSMPVTAMGCWVSVAELVVTTAM